MNSEINDLEKLATTSMSNTQYTKFAIFLHQIEGKILTQEAISLHVDHLAQLDQNGKLVLCGPFADHPSGMVIVSAKDKEEAQSIAMSDPFVKLGFRTFEVRTWLIACKENNYLK